MRRYCSILTLLLLTVATQAAENLPSPPANHPIPVPAHVEPTQQQLFDRWKAAAESGDATAQAGMGDAYLSWPRDPVKAAAWYRKAAGQGNAEAQYSLGTLLEQGGTLPQDPTQAAAWLRRAAEQGHYRAMFALGQLYADGFGVDRDYVLAYVMLDLVVQHAGSPQSRYYAADRDALAQRMTPEQLVEARALGGDWQPGTSLPVKSASGRTLAFPERDQAAATKRWGRQIQSTVEPNWITPAGDLTTRAALIVATLGPRGEITAASLDGTSGDTAFDQSALQSLRQTGRIEWRASAALGGSMKLCFAWVPDSCPQTPSLVLIAGPRTLGQIQEGFDRAKGVLTKFYLDAFPKGKPTPDGRIVLSLVIDASGTITDCAIVNSTFADKEFEAKFLGVVRSVSFGRWAGPPFVLEKYPVEFHPM